MQRNFFFLSPKFFYSKLLFFGITRNKMFLFSQKRRIAHFISLLLYLYCWVNIHYLICHWQMFSEKLSSVNMLTHAFLGKQDWKAENQLKTQRQLWYKNISKCLLLPQNSFSSSSFLKLNTWRLFQRSAISKLNYNVFNL